MSRKQGLIETRSVRIVVEDENGQIINENGEPTLKQRHGYKTETFRTEYRQPDPEPLPCRERCKNALKKLCSSAICNKKNFGKLLPIIRIYEKYQIKTDLPNDVISGFTVGIMQLPQGMAYAMLADLPPVVGLYMSFFPVLVYFLLGTSRHISMGTVAVVSLMIGSVVSTIGKPLETTITSLSQENVTMATMNDSLFNTTNLNATQQTTVISNKNEIDMQKIAMASTMCLMVGFIQVIFGACRLGLVTTYMSDPLVSGFTTGAGVHVFTSQVKYIFGLTIPRYPNLLQIVYTYIAIISNLHKTNLPTLLISAICIVILYLIKVQVNYRFKDKMKIPVPIELVVVVIGTVLSHFLKFKKNYGIKVVGHIPAGLPTPSAPPMTGASDYFSDAVIIGIVAFAQSVSLAALMAKKHKYTIDLNQEFIAYGVGNIFGSFFSCYPFAASVSRSSVQDSAGGRTQIASVFSAALVLVVILWIGPLFEDLPNCVLASIIVVALRSIFYQVFELKELWKTSIYDFFIWIVTFVSVVILYVDLGLWIGLIFSFLTVVVRTQLTKPMTLEKIEALDTYADKRKYKQTQDHPGILIFSLDSPLYYANADIFIKRVTKISNSEQKRPRSRIKKTSIQEFRRKISAISATSQDSKHGRKHRPNRISVPDRVGSLARRGSLGVTFGGHTELTVPSEEEIDAYLHHIIIDCSSMCFIDTVGGKALIQLVREPRNMFGSWTGYITAVQTFGRAPRMMFYCAYVKVVYIIAAEMFAEYNSLGIRVLLACVKDDVWSVLSNIGFLEEYRDDIYFSVADAVSAANDDLDLFLTNENEFIIPLILQD